MGFNGPWFNSSKKDGNQIRMDGFHVAAARLAEKATLLWTPSRYPRLGVIRVSDWTHINPRKISGKRYEMMIWGPNRSICSCSWRKSNPKNGKVKS